MIFILKESIWVLKLNILTNTMKILLSILLLFPLLTFSQEIRPNITGTQKAKEIYVKGYNTSKYKGYMFNTGKGIIRFRTFSNDALQLTYIIGKNRQFRAYLYYDIYDKQITKAISLRFFI